MYCVNCGKEIDDRAVICVHCGVPTHNFTRNFPPIGLKEEERDDRKINVFGLVGFILGIVSIFYLIVARSISPFFAMLSCAFVLTGPALSLVGFIKRDKYKLKGIAVAGFVIGITVTCFWALFTCIFLGELFSGSYIVGVL